MIVDVHKLTSASGQNEQTGTHSTFSFTMPKRKEADDILNNCEALHIHRAALHRRHHLIV